MANFDLRSQIYTGLTDRSWMQNDFGAPEANKAVVLDVSKFTPSVHYPDGVIHAGIILGQVTATGMYGPYSGTTDTVEVLTEGGSGLTSFTLTWNGQTTGSLAAAATAAQVQTALAALSNIGAGNVLVTGANGGPYTVSFVNALANVADAAITTTPTGGSGTVTESTTVAGGAAGSSDGLQIPLGILYDDEQVNFLFPTATATKLVAPLMRAGYVIVANLPANSGYDPNVKTTLTKITWE